MSVKELLKEIRKRNIDLSVDGGSLLIRDVEGQIPLQLHEEINKNQAEIISYLKKNQYDAADHASIPGSGPMSGYPLSSAQMRLWILSQLGEGNVAYNMPESLVIEGSLNKAAFEYAFMTLLDRHEILRTVFKEDEEGVVRQYTYVSGQRKFALTIVDLRGVEDNDREVNEMVRQEFSKRFDLSSGPLLRAGLYQTEDDKWVFAFVMHHIISDGWSMSILINELLLYYAARCKGLSNPLAPLRIQYKDYAVWQQDRLSGSQALSDKAYWMQQFIGDLTVLDLPGCAARPQIRTNNGGVVNKVFDPGVVKGLRGLASKEGCSLFMGLLSVVAALLQRYTGLEDLTIGTPIAGRDHVDLENQIGFYANTLALRMKFGKDVSGRELLQYIKQVTLGAYEHQMYPFDELVKDLKLNRDMSRNPLFDVEVVLQNTKVRARQQNDAGGLVIKEYAGDGQHHSVFDMVFNFIEVGDGLQLNIIFNSDLYLQDVVERMADHLGNLLGQMILFPETSIARLDYMTVDEKRNILQGFNDTASLFDDSKTIVNLFEEWVKIAPDSAAVVFGGRTLTYRELNDSAEKLAYYLKINFEAKADNLIGVLMDRSDRMIIAILGILKSGAAYVPIDPDYPLARKKYIIADTGLKGMITEAHYLLELDYYEGPVFAIDVQLDTLEAASLVKPSGIGGNDLAYVIYTSGSTGHPKGVMIEHGQIINTIYSQQVIFQVQASERGLQFASIAFDASVWEIFLMLSAGGVLYIIEEGQKKSPVLLQQFLTENKIDIATLPPAFVRIMEIEEMRFLKKLITAGEAAVADTAEHFSKYGIYYNAYGPTETSICASVYRFENVLGAGGRQVPIGRPMPNTQVYILDEHMTPVPVGVAGNICIGGKGLARGYWNRPELTQEKFVPNPYREGERLYKTGDTGRWLSGGNIEFIGRVDDQVKLHGYRIELGEIENTLQHHPDVASAAVMVSGGTAGDQRLVAYLVSERKLIASEIRSYLSKELPFYMVPDIYVQLPFLPLTSSGKVDKKALSDPRGQDLDADRKYVPPRNAMEEKLVVIWQELLGKEKIGIEDNFFEVGGNSISIIKLSRSVSKALNRDISIAALFQYTNIKDLVDFVVHEPSFQTDNFFDGDQVADELEKFNF